MSHGKEMRVPKDGAFNRRVNSASSIDESNERKLVRNETYGIHRRTKTDLIFNYGNDDVNRS